MLPHTPSLAAQVRAASTTTAKVDLLHQAYAGADCVVVTCGPSLARHAPDRLREATDGRLVIAVKQAIDVAGPSADFLCFNAYNASDFGASGPSTLHVFSQDPGARVTQQNRVDISLPQAPHTGRLEDSLAASRDFDSALLSRSELRPWGPGILHEVVIPLAVHLGARSITTIGWDIANANGNNTHFYDAPDDDFFDRGRTAYRAIGIRKHLPDPVRKGIRRARAAVLHRGGRIYNRTTMIDGEADLVAASVPPMAAWLAGLGIELRVVTDSPLFGDKITRLSTEQFYAG